MQFITDIFAAGRRFAAAFHKSADLLERVNAEAEARLDGKAPPLLRGRTTPRPRATDATAERR